MSNITFNTTYEGLPIYSGSKSLHGLNLSILKSAYGLVTEALQTMRRPVGFHFVINEPTSGANNLDQILTRWGEQMGLTSKPLYMKVQEVRPRNNQRHLHVHVIADMPKQAKIIKQEIDFLIVGMRGKNLGSAIQLYPRDRATLLREIDPETGEVKILSSPWFHDLRREFQDYFLRLSYLAKVFTKNHSLRNWSCSNLKNRQHYTFKKEESKKLTLNLIKRIHRKSDHCQLPSARKSANQIIFNRKIVYAY